MNGLDNKRSLMRRAARTGAVLASLLLFSGCAASSKDSSTRAVADNGPVPTIHMDADHPTYPNASQLAASADVIVTGAVVSQTTDPGVSPGNDEAGDPIPPVPHTNYTIAVRSASKGNAAPGDQLVVSLPGGTTPGGHFILDGGPILDDSAAHLFYLTPGDGGMYYPLAGGAAVAARQADGTFALPPDVSGGEALHVTQSGEALPAGTTGGGGGGASNPPPAGAVPAGGVAGLAKGSVSTAQIRASLTKQITPRGKAAKIAAVRRNRMFRLPFKALTPGEAVVSWYQVPKGARLTTKSHKPKPTLVATGKLTFASARTKAISVKLTAAGERLLKGATRLKLTAKGTFKPSGQSIVSAKKTFTLKT